MIICLLLKNCRSYTIQDMNFKLCTVEFSFLILWYLKIKFSNFAASTPDRSKAMRKFYLVFEFCEHDLAGILSNTSLKFSLGQLKLIMWQLLNALFFIHGNNIIHRWDSNLSLFHFSLIFSQTELFYCSCKLKV